jgi:tRNA threonylcarbamoyladenosine biosynthesis protein TsaE
MIVPAEGEFRLTGEAHAGRLGAALGKVLERGEAVCLTGPLGAGKSVVARGLIRALCPAEADVPSPTFTLVQTYDGPRFAIAHIDLYRLARADEAFELGLDDALKSGAAVIEWAERLGHHLPANRIDVDIALDGEARRARLTPHGAWEGRPIDL